MGVPKFYRWISERYPKINQIISDNALLPEFDHLYLDMNGIIHGCTHPSHLDISDVLSERDMMMGIMHYLDRIITQIVKPKVSIYMAIDGVAPRAKLNQQRSRRFRSAKDMAEATKDMPANERAVFDSNCITPGTEFLAKVSEHIKYFIRKKLKEDPLWQGLTVIFSGHDIPGEGEHKIMQHIRELRSQPGYQPNNRHCIYGQDADLIMLSLITHEPHFTILREVINFNFSHDQQNSLKAVKKFTKASDFQLLHISILREYLHIEFCREYPEYDLERTIDDFVFMTFLVGNDFLPHLPSLDIGDGAFDLLFSIYKDQRSGWGTGNYMTQSGEISDPYRLEDFVAAIGAVETDILKKREKDEVVYRKKKRQWDKRDGRPAGPSDAELAEVEAGKQGDYVAMIEALSRHPNWAPENFVAGWEPVTQPGEKDFKGRYYFEKLKFTPLDKEKHWMLRRSYMEGLMWCLAYYYKGCISWGWFFPYHYGPMLSDLIDIPRMFSEIKFELGEPLTPFQQLMGCLPPASSQLVPKLYRSLMVAPDSPISNFYPLEFQVDMNGKKNPWEGVNLLPFIDIALLKSTIAEHCPSDKLSAVERVRNSIGTVYCYRHDPTCADTVPSPNQQIGLPDISSCHSSVNTIGVDDGPSDVYFQPKLVDGTQLPFPGFPSLNVLPIASVKLEKIGLNCFGSASKYPNTVLHLCQLPELVSIEQLADSLLGKSVFVNWPMMHEGKVVAVSSEKKTIKVTHGRQRNVVEHTKVSANKWRSESVAMFQMYHTGNGVPGSGGVHIGPISIRIRLVPLQGMKTNPANGSKKKLFGTQEADVPLQLCLLQAPAPDPRFVEHGPMTLGDRFPMNANVVLTKGKYRGCSGRVVSIADKKNVAVNVKIIPPETPFGLYAVREAQEPYLSSIEVAKMLRMNGGILGKIMGRLQFEPGRYDLGLNLKTSDGLCVVGYTRKRVENTGKKGNGARVWSAGDSLRVIGSQGRVDGVDKEERIQWEYTPRAVQLVDEYRRKFPQLFSKIMKSPNEKKYDAKTIFGNNGEAWLPVIREWLDKHETAKLPRTPVTTEAMPYEAVAKVEKYAAIRTLALKKKGYPKESLIKIPGSALYREGSTAATDVLLAADLNKNEAPALGDRVVNLCAEGIPFGAKGTVIGIHEAASTGCVEVVMDDEFIGGTTLQGACSNFRGKLCLWAHLLKVTPENATALVNKMVPKMSDKANTDRMRSLLNSQVNQHKAPLAVEAPPVTTPVAVPLPTPQSNSIAQPRAASRNGSATRGKQASWEQARGPDKSGIGFKLKRKGKKSGFKAWQELVSNSESSLKSSTPKTLLRRPDPQPVQSEGVQTEAAKLKAMLGVASPPLEGTATDEPSAAKLKAMLGVTSPPPASASTIEPAAKLKAMLGVGSSPPMPAIPNQPAGVQSNGPVTLNHPTPHPPAPATAADKLMALMSQQRQGPSNGPAFGYGQGPPMGFNFTYVEEGQDPMPVTLQMPKQVQPLMYAPQMTSFEPPSAGNGKPSNPSLTSNDAEFPALRATLAPAPLETSQETKTTEIMIPSIFADKIKQ